MLDEEGLRSDRGRRVNESVVENSSRGREEAAVHGCEARRGREMEDVVADESLEEFGSVGSLESEQRARRDQGEPQLRSWDACRECSAQRGPPRERDRVDQKHVERPEPESSRSKKDEERRQDPSSPLPSFLSALVTSTPAFFFKFSLAVSPSRLFFPTLKRNHSHGGHS
jgi:hypothetical protein